MFWWVCETGKALSERERAEPKDYFRATRDIVVQEELPVFKFTISGEPGNGYNYKLRGGNSYPKEDNEPLW